MSLPPGCFCLLFCLNPWVRIALALRIRDDHFLKMVWGGAGGMMAQQLGMFTALAKDLSLVSHACTWLTTACNSILRGSDALFKLLQTAAQT